MAVELTSNEVTNRNAATYTLALGLFSLSGVLIYLVVLITEVTDLIPGILKSVDDVTVLIDPIVEQIDEITDLIPPIIDEVEQIRILVHPVIDETESIRKSFQPILKEVKQTRKQVPNILKETALVRTQVNDVNDTLNETLKILPVVLEEMEKTRIELPILLTRAEQLVDAANDAGEEVSEGAVTGFFTGILKAPFSIISSLADSIFGEMDMEDGYTDDDREMIVKLSHETLEMGMMGETREWVNPENGHMMRVSLMHEMIDDNNPCKSINIEASGDDDAYIEKEITLCKEENAEWVMLK